jgi:hypothetical protein
MTDNAMSSDDDVMALSPNERRQECMLSREEELKDPIEQIRAGLRIYEYNDTSPRSIFNEGIQVRGKRVFFREPTEEEKKFLRVFNKRILYSFPLRRESSKRMKSFSFYVIIGHCNLKAELEKENPIFPAVLVD